MQAALNAYQPDLTPTPTPPEANLNILVAGGTGTDPSGGGADVLVVPFNQAPVLSIGNYVTQNPTTLTQFDINSSGIYQINFQLAVYNSDGTGPEVLAELTSANLGIIDTLNLFQNHVVAQDSFTISLQAGDVISLVLRSIGQSVFNVNSQVITFMKVG